MNSIAPRTTPDFWIGQLSVFIALFNIALGAETGWTWICLGLGFLSLTGWAFGQCNEDSP